MPLDLPGHLKNGPENEDGFDLIRPLAIRQELRLSELYFILRRRRALLVIWLIIGIALALVFTWMSQKRYSSTVTIQVLKEGDSALGLEDLSGISSNVLSGDSMTVDLLTQQTVIGNENVALTVVRNLQLFDHEPFQSLIPKGAIFPPGTSPIDDPEIREKIVRLFQSRLKVTLVKGTRLIDVTYTDQNPKQAAAIANAVVEAYVVDVTQERYDATAKTSKWLTNQISDLKEKVTESQNRVNDFRQKTGLIGARTVPNAEHGQIGGPALDPVELDRLSDLNGRLTAAEVSRISDDAIYHLTEGASADAFLGVASQPTSEGSAGSLVEAANLDIGHLKQLRSEEGQIKVDLASNTVKYGAKNPVIVGQRRQLAELDHQIASEMQRLHSEAKDDLELATATENALRSSVGAEKARIARLNSNADQLLLLEQEEASNRALYESLYSRLEAANVLAGAKSSNITIVNPARVPARPSHPQPGENLGVGILAGLAVGVFGAFASEYRNDSIATPEDLSSVTGLPLLGLIPIFKGRNRSKPNQEQRSPEELRRTDSPVWVLRAPRSAIAEAYRQIRTAVLLSRPGQAPNTILFSSCVSGDGKTTTCLNSAFAFALQGSRVLIVDADMRKPSVHGALRLSNEAGLSNCLSSDIDPHTVIRKHTDLDSLFVMTAGPIPPDPSELLGSKRFAELFRQLEGNFDFVFIDAPPILMVTDPVLMSQHVDGVILVIRAGVTRRGFLKRAMDLLAASRRHILGVVLNAADVRSSEYNSAYGYYGDRSYYHDDDE